MLEPVAQLAITAIPEGVLDGGQGDVGGAGSIAWTAGVGTGAEVVQLVLLDADDAPVARLAGVGLEECRVPGLAGAVDADLDPADPDPLVAEAGPEAQPENLVQARLRLDCRMS